ncbi:MAG: hypothetical protein KF861_21295, partial [Planctomycetaceae bacterium]|nr:hypothetical protein [Planctomycetaceae bacterium]
TEIECETVDCTEQPQISDDRQDEIRERLEERRQQAGDGPLLFDRKPLLMTGADLLNGTKKGITIPLGYAPGMQVRHPQYGRGTVTATDGFGSRRTVTVRFEDADAVKTFHAAKSPLQPIGT